MKLLPPKFAQIIALMDSSCYEHERITAREKATTLANKHGLSFEDALRATPRANPRDLPSTRAEVYAAETAAAAARAKQEAKQREQRAKLAPLIELYGSIDAALAPCWRERLLVDAVARWRVAFPAQNQRWTMTLDGVDSIGRMPDHVRRAVSLAYPLPDFLSGQTKNSPLLRAFVRSEVAPISAVNTRTGVCIDVPPRGRHTPTREHFEVDNGSGFRFRLDRLRAMKRHWQAALNRTFGSAPIQAVADPIGVARQQALEP